MPGYFLNDGDRDAIQQLLRDKRNTPIKRRTRSTPEPNYEAPEVYIAKTPDSGIPALEQETGTGIVDTPGAAYCDIYRVLPNSSNVLELVPATSQQKRVYNLSTLPVAGGIWVVIVRDKFGSWLVPPRLDDETETVVLTVTSDSTVDSRYPAAIRIQEGLPSEWGTDDDCWAYEVRGNTLRAGYNYIGRRNTDQYLGLEQFAVDYCCSGTAATECGCDIPTYLCLTFSSSATCLDGTTVLMTNGRSAQFCSCCGGLQRFTLICNSDDEWSLLYSRTSSDTGGSTTVCTYECRLQIDSVTVDCGDDAATGTSTASVNLFRATASGILTSGNLACPDQGVAWTATMTEVSDPDECDEMTNCSDTGSGCCDDEPYSFQMAITVTSGTCDQLEAITLGGVLYQTSTNIWEGFFSVGSCFYGPMTITLTCSGDDYYISLSSSDPLFTGSLDSSTVLAVKDCGPPILITGTFTTNGLFTLNICGEDCSNPPFGFTFVITLTPA